MYERLPESFTRKDIGDMVLNLTQYDDLRSQGQAEEADLYWQQVERQFRDEEFSEAAFDQLVALAAQELKIFGRN